MSWERVALEELSQKVTSGGTPSTKEERYYGGDIPWLRTQEVTFNNIYDTEIKITEDGLKNSAAKWIPSDSVIVAMYGNSAGRVAINKIPLTTNQACCNLIIDTGKADYRFVYYALSKDYEVLHALSRGAAQNNLNAADVRRYEILLPSLPVQQKIASILSAYDDLIDNNRKRIALLEKATRLLYEEWFVRLQFPGHEHTPVVDGVPQGWEKVLLPDAVDINPRTKVAADGEKWFVEMSRLSNSSMVISEPVMKEGNSGSKFKNHDTLLARITPCLENGKTGYVNFLKEDESGFGSTEFIVLRGKKVPSQFVYCLARTEHFRGTAITSMVGSSGRQRVQTAALDDYEMLLPTKGLLDIFEATVKPAFEAVRVLSAQTQKLQAARDLLLPRLMSGELAV